MIRGFANQENVKHFEMLPNVTSNSFTIEQRAECLARNVSRISRKHKQKVHILAYSFAGVDARCATSLMDMHEHC
jgi:hypothetical protein